MNKNSILWIKKPLPIPEQEKGVSTVRKMDNNDHN